MVLGMPAPRNDVLSFTCNTAYPVFHLPDSIGSCFAWCQPSGPVKEENKQQVVYWTNTFDKECIWKQRCWIGFAGLTLVTVKIWQKSVLTVHIWMQAYIHFCYKICVTTVNFIIHTGTLESHFWSMTASLTCESTCMSPHMTHWELTFSRMA